MCSPAVNSLEELVLANVPKDTIVLLLGDVQLNKLPVGREKRVSLSKQSFKKIKVFIVFLLCIKVIFGIFPFL